MTAWREIAIFGGGTFLAVSAFAVMAMPRPAEHPPVITPTPEVTVQLSEIVRDPQLVEIGQEPPPGVIPDSAYTKHQIEAFLSKRNGMPLEVTEAVDISGSQATTYCGTAISRDGRAHSFSIVVWSTAPIEHTLSNEPASCTDGLTLVRDGQPIARENAPQDGNAAYSPIHANSAARDPMYDHIDKVSTYAVLIGRGAACGVDTSAPAAKVGAWLERVAPRGSQAQVTLLPMLMEQSHYHAQQQKNGQSPDNCATVARAIARFPWPS